MRLVGFVGVTYDSCRCNVLHIPDSSPTAKQLLSVLNATESTAVGLDASIGGRTFMVGAMVLEDMRWLVVRRR